MSYFLNNDNSKLIRYMKSGIFIDKSMIIKECNKLLAAEYPYFSIWKNTIYFVNIKCFKCIWLTIY